MAHFGYGTVPQTQGYDEYGNPIHQIEEYGHPVRQTDEYGNPVHHSGTTTAGYGTGGIDTTTATGLLRHGGAPAAGTGIGVGHHDKGHHGLHRSGSSSSSSSSSEDDGHGGRRKKKGLQEKIKEKLPGVGHKDDRVHSHTTTSTPGGYGITGEGQHQEKKGMVEKIKEKLPGHHH